MASIDLRGTLKALKGERAKVNEELSKLDKAIAALQGLNGVSATSANPNATKRTISAAGRRRIAKAQKLRWAKLKQAKKAADK